jgi:hypothetical protein
MKSKIFKSILAIILLSVSPFIVLAVTGMLYVIIQMIRGLSFTVVVQSFVNFIYSLISFFPYITTIPILIVLAIIIVKKKQKLFSKR